MKKSRQHLIAGSQHGVRRTHISRKLLGGIVFLSLLLRLNVVGAQEHHPHHPMPLDKYIALLEDPKRDEWQKPDAVIKALNLQQGQVVADVGAGSGYFTLRLAHAVAPKGTVLAVDVDDGMLNYLRQRLAQENITNVQVMKVPAHDPLLIDGSLDVAFLCNVYHHLEDREVYMQKVRKALKPNGRLVIVDFYKKEGIPVGPPMHMRLSEDEVQKELQTAGLKVTEKLTLLPYQYILIVQTMTGASVPSLSGNL